MIEEITSDSINNLNKSFINVEYIKNEFSINPYAKLLVYKRKNEILGYLYYSDIYERAEINQIEVDVIHRNCGIGSKLLSYLIKTVDKSISLEVKIDNFNAIKLYKKYNFKKVSIRKNYYNGVDGILMVKE